MKYENILNTWQGYNIKTSEELLKYLWDWRILFAYHSGKIENSEINFYDTRELFESGRFISNIKNPSTIFEMNNQKLCSTYLIKKIGDKVPLSVELIKETHRILATGAYDEKRYIVNGERPGEFKNFDYVTGVNEVGSKALDVEKDLESLVEEINNFDSDDILLAAAYFHVRFESIHPFADVNGRTGRTLLNYYLLINNYPPVIIYEEDRLEYYQCLQKYDETDEIKPFKDFIIKQSIKTWADSIEEHHKSLKELQ